MLIRLVVLVSVAALGLALAACAEMAEGMAASAAAQAAQIAATQAEMATTQAINQLEVASSQMSRRIQSGQPLIALPNLPPIHKGTMILVLPDAIVIQKDNHRYIFPRTPQDYQNSGNVLPSNLQNPEDP
jgi:hypothetical protein